MSYEKKKEVLLYHAFALGAGGYVERDFKSEPIPLSAPLALSVSGGSGQNRQKNYEFVFRDPNKKRGADFRMTIGEVFTEVAATELEDRWLTTGRSELTNVDINGVVKADFVRGLLNSMHLKRKSLRSKKIEASVVTKGSEIRNLTVNGNAVLLANDDTIDRNPTHDGLRKFVNAKQKTAQAFRQCNFLEKSGSKVDYICDMERFNSPSHIRASIYGSIALEKQSDRVRAHCYSLDIDDFGRLYIGEVIVSHGSKRLNMLRFDLGCTNCGGGTGGSVDLNGETVP